MTALINLVACACLHLVPVTYVVDGVDDGVARIESPAGSVVTLPAVWFPDAREGGKVRVLHLVW